MVRFSARKSPEFVDLGASSPVRERSAVASTPDNKEALRSEPLNCVGIRSVGLRGLVTLIGTLETTGRTHFSHLLLALISRTYPSHSLLAFISRTHLA